MMGSIACGGPEHGDGVDIAGDGHKAEAFVEADGIRMGVDVEGKAGVTGVGVFEEGVEELGAQSPVSNFEGDGDGEFGDLRRDEAVAAVRSSPGADVRGAERIAIVRLADHPPIAGPSPTVDVAVDVGIVEDGAGERLAVGGYVEGKVEDFE
jgi:hypothetical protein